jgi:hypothetical protein
MLRLLSPLHKKPVLKLDWKEAVSKNCSLLIIYRLFFVFVNINVFGINDVIVAAVA